MKSVKLGFVVAITLIASTTIAAARELSCRKPDEQAISRNIQAIGDRVLFNYYPSELVDEFTLEYLNCQTSASISIEIPNERHAEKAGSIVKIAIDSPVEYYISQIIDALKKAGYKAQPGKLDTDVCACFEKVLTKARRRY